MNVTLHLLGITDDAWQWIAGLLHALPMRFKIDPAIHNGSTAEVRLKNDRRTTSFASKAVEIFLIGFGIKLTTN
jgi:hypothetical protein